MTSTAEANPPAIEQIAAELRRLDRQRTSPVVGQSMLWQKAVERAYDEWLRLACWRLGVTEHIGALRGPALDDERWRIEAALAELGLFVPRSFDGTFRQSRWTRRKRSAVARIVLAVAVTALPRADRGRFHEEFAAELLDLAMGGASESQQLLYAVRQFFAVAELRATLRRRNRP